MNDHALRMNAGIMTPKEIVAKALGMSHPLCRSSTSEAGSFTLGIHRGGGMYEHSRSDDVDSGGNAPTYFIWVGRLILMF
jgi:hypothetical protein